MKNLINILKEETKTLKTQYLEMTKAWSEKQLERNVKFKEDYGSGKLGYDNPQNEKRYWNSPSWTFTQEFIPRMEKRAEEHYNNSIERLAARIEKKGLNQANLTTVTGHVGVNIETTLTDGEKTVTAWTIIASGPIQRPHYRYLVK